MAEKRCPFKLIMDETMEYPINKNTLYRVHKSPYFGPCEYSHCPFYQESPTRWCSRES